MLSPAYIGTRARGIGKRIQLDGTRIYNMLGDPRRAVRIRRAGHSPTVLVCKEPEALLDAIQEARSRTCAKVRVAPEEIECEVPLREFRLESESASESGA